MQHFDILNNKREFRFEVALPGGAYATLTYRWLKGDMLLMQTIVPPSATGTDLADTLIRHVLDHARAHGLRIKVYCPLVSGYMEKHMQYDDIVAA